MLTIDLTTRDLCYKEGCRNDSDMIKNQIQRASEYPKQELKNQKGAKSLIQVPETLSLLLPDVKSFNHSRE